MHVYFVYVCFYILVKDSKLPGEASTGEGPAVPLAEAFFPNCTSTKFPNIPVQQKRQPRSGKP